MKRLSLSLFLTCLLAVAGYGVANAGTLKISSNDFGDTCGDAVTQDVKLGKTGAGTIAIESVTIDGPDGADFAINTDGCTGNSVPGPCSINITFTPSVFGTRTAALVVHAPTADNADANGDVTFADADALTAVSQGCGDGEINCSETCDFNDVADGGVDCCNDTCDAVVDLAPVTCSAQGGCLIDGTCNADGNCENTTSAGDGAACSTGDACIENQTCLSDECQGGNDVVCPLPAECFEALDCSPIEGCLVVPAAAGTSCDNGNGTCDGSGNCQTGGGGSCSLMATGAAESSSLYFSLLMGSVAVMGLFRRFRHR